MRRDVVIEVSSRGMIKTGLKSDICQVCLASHMRRKKIINHSGMLLGNMQVTYSCQATLTLGHMRQRQIRENSRWSATCVCDAKVKMLADRNWKVAGTYISVD